MSKPYALSLQVYPLASQGGHQESGTPQVNFTIEDGALIITVWGPKGQTRLYAQFADHDVLALTQWLSMASRELWGMEKKPKSLSP